MASFLKSKKAKVVIVALIVLVILFGSFITYIDILITNIVHPPSGVALPKPLVRAYIGYEDMISTNYGRDMYPFVVIAYNAVNSSSIYVNATVYKYQPPKRIYILNYTNFCYLCGNVTQVVNSLTTSLAAYNLTDQYGNVTKVSLNHLNQISNDSILIVLNGLLPSQMFEIETGNESELQYLLSKHTSIIYVGLNFSNMLIPGSVPTEAPSPGVPDFLQTFTSPVLSSIKNSPLYLDNASYYFPRGGQYGPVTYQNFSNGSLVAFPNTLSQWPSPSKAGKDIAKVIQSLLWLPRYASGSSTTLVKGSGFGNSGVLLDDFAVPYNVTLPSKVDSGYLRVGVSGSSLYNSTYQYYYYINAMPGFISRGTAAIATFVVPNQSYVPITFNITSKPNSPVNISTYIAVYNQNLYQLYTAPGPSIHDFSKASPPFIVHQNLTLGPGNYIVMLRNFSDNSELAAGFFIVSPIEIGVIRAATNVSSGTFVFRATSENKTLTNINYNISLNNLYPSHGTVQEGIISYQLPAGTPIQTGLLNFTVTMLGQNFYFLGYHPATPVSINAEYVELGVVIAMILIMVLFVHAPQKDEFYIDVPNLPEEKKTKITLKSAELLSVFDKLNTNYHWKYMPLSKAEVRSAIALNVRSNSIPVELTYHNIDSILDSMQVNRKVVSSDELYAPVSWIEASKHDIDYLATFKKLRIYFVTHSYTFTDMGASTEADIVANLRGEKKFFVIHSKTSAFSKLPLYPNTRLHLVFLNSYQMEEFKSKLYNILSDTNERLKMYISADYIRLVDADDIERDIS